MNPNPTELESNPTEPLLESLPVANREAVAAALAAARADGAAAALAAARADGAGADRMVPDPDAVPPVVAWVAGGRVCLSTPWKAPARLFGDVDNVATFRGALAAARARWAGPDAANRRPYGYWHGRADDMATALRALRDVGFAPEMATDYDDAAARCRRAEAARPKVAAAPRGRSARTAPRHGRPALASPMATGDAAAILAAALGTSPTPPQE